MIIKIKPTRPDFILPTRATEGASGFDLYAAEPVVVPFSASYVVVVPLGFSIEVPSGIDCQIRLRSSVSNHGLIIPNAPGTIDSDYRGEVKVMLMNLSRWDMHIDRGERIAQMVFLPLMGWEFCGEWKFPKLDVVDELSETNRGTGGFGSTGR